MGRFLVAVVLVVTVAGCGSDNDANVGATGSASQLTTIASTSATSSTTTTVTTTLPTTTTTPEPATSPPPSTTQIEPLAPEVTEPPTTTIAEPEPPPPPPDEPTFAIDTCGDNHGPAAFGAFTGSFRTCGRSFTVRAVCNSGDVTVTVRDPGGDLPEGWLSIGLLVDDETHEVYKPAPRAAGEVLSSVVQRNVTIWGTGKSTRPALVEYDCRN